MRRLHYEPALDGLRGVAILCVVIHHSRWLPGGFLGVHAFFVLSGFLITSLLLQEWWARDAISLRLFYRRRALRLLPALIAFLLVVVGLELAKLLAGDLSAGQLRTELGRVAWGASYVSNFAKAAGVSLGSLGHLWSLATEEQFYLVWPPILLLFLRRSVSPRMLCGVLAVAAAAVVAHRILLASQGVGWDYLSSSPTTTSDPLIIGCLAGVVYMCRPALPLRLSASVRRWLWVPPFAVAALVVWAADGAWRTWAFAAGLLPFELSIALLILVALTEPRSVASQALRVSPLVAIGKISYSLYLWHPLFIWHSVLVRLALPLGLAISFIVATVSYRYIERPFLRRKTKLYESERHTRHEPDLVGVPAAARSTQTVP